HGSRQPASWLIFDVRHTMKKLSILLLCGLALGSTVLFGRAKEPAPLQMVPHAGREIPLYDVKSVRPKSTVPPTYPSELKRGLVDGSASVVALVSEEGVVLA